MAPAQPAAAPLQAPAAGPGQVQAAQEATPQKATGEADAYLGALTRIGVELDEVDAALARLEEDQQQFDQCSACGAPIGLDRLLDDPLLTTCAAHTGAAHTGAAPA